MRFNEILSEAPVAAAQPAAPAVAPKPGIVDKTLSGAAKVAGAIDAGAGAIRSVQNKLKNFGGERDPFSAVSKNQLKSILSNVIAGKQLTPQDIATLTKFSNSL